MPEKFGKLFKIENNVLESTVDVSHFYGKSLGVEIVKALKNNSETVKIIDGKTDQHLTGQQVLDEVLKLASSLLGQGLIKGDIIGFYNDCKYLAYNAIGFMASIVAGLTYTACDNRYPYEELLQLCRRSGVTVLISSELTLDVALRVRDQLPQIKRVFILDKSISNVSNENVPYIFDLVPSQDKVKLPVTVDSERDVPLIGFSSGTTGLPKAVRYNHRNVIAFVGLGLKPFNFTSRRGDTVLIYCPLHHILDIGTFVSALLHGSRIVLYPCSEPWLIYGEKYRATTAAAVSSDINVFAKNYAPYSIESVTDIIVIGSKVNPNAADQFMKNYKVGQLRNNYGCTETGYISMFPSDLDEKQDITCSGIVLPGVKVKVVDKDNGKICGAKEVGIICAKTPATSLGYLNNEQANKEAFDEDGFFKTDDVGYYDANGQIYVTGRLKEIFKCDGCTVSPTEIEEILMTHESVQEAAVFGKIHDNYGEVAKAFVVLKPNQTATETELMEELIGYVNDKMVSYKHLIGGVEFMSSFPRTLRVKIDRKVLRSRI